MQSDGAGRLLVEVRWRARVAGAGRAAGPETGTGGMVRFGLPAAPRCGPGVHLARGHAALVLFLFVSWVIYLTGVDCDFGSF
jgi:hypothetical protein